MKIVFTLSASFALLLLAFACTKIKSYPDEPELKVLSVVPADSGMVTATVHFTDGDGDIGLATGDTLPPFNPTSEFYNNMIVEYYEFQNGNWIKGNEFKYRIQPITPEGKIKVLEGEMTISLFYNTFSPLDTIKYTFQLSDRALHKSNVADSGPIVIVK